MNKEKNYFRAWVRSVRNHGSVMFLDLYGIEELSCLQVVYKGETLSQAVTAGSFIGVEGNWLERSGQREFVVESLVILASCREDYPIQNKKCSLEFLRSIPWVRGRSRLFENLYKIRSSLCGEIHRLLQSEGFVWIPTPVLTSNNCEGGSDIFNVQNDGFFQKVPILTVSGQLYLEAAVMGLGKAYCFGPTFRAEKSNSKRHLAEFWMLEFEAHDWDREKTMSFVELLIKSLVSHVVSNNLDNLKAIYEITGIDCLKELIDLIEKPFSRCTYSEGIVKCGLNEQADLSFENEKKLSSEGALFITDFPMDNAPFYMEKSQLKGYSESFDLILPGVGEVVGGGVRTNDSEKKIPEGLEWYFNIKQWGCVGSAGCGIGFERLLSFICGIENVKDCAFSPNHHGSFCW